MKVRLTHPGDPGQTAFSGLSTSDATPQVIHEPLLKLAKSHVPGLQKYFLVK